MIVCFNCSRETKDILDEILNKGDYRDYDEIISIAIANLAVLESQSNKSTVIFAKSEIKADSHRILISDNQPDKKITLPFVGKDGYLLNNVSLPKENPMTVDMPDIEQFQSNPPISKWIFGQYNKLLPIKLSCRAIANLIIEEGCLEIEKVAIRIANLAASLGDLLENYDKKNDMPRHMKFSTAFPSSGPSGEKSRRRFANQFVGSQNSQSELSGLLFDLRLVNLCQDKESISLTTPGWIFAQLDNPVLTTDLINIPSKLSKEEVIFLLTHIKENVPVEFYAYNLILNSITKGRNRPESLDAFLKEYLPEENVTDAFISTQRAGVISRLTDLTLIKREHEGNKVIYLVSDLGKNFLSNRI